MALLFTASDIGRLVEVLSLAIINAFHRLCFFAVSAGVAVFDPVVDLDGVYWGQVLRSLEVISGGVVCADDHFFAANYSVPLSSFPVLSPSCPFSVGDVLSIDLDGIGVAIGTAPCMIGSNASLLIEYVAMDPSFGILQANPVCVT